jgi:hypothetical protein
VFNGKAALVAEREDCEIKAPTFEYAIPSVDDCHWMFPTLPDTKDRFTLFP